MLSLLEWSALLVLVSAATDFWLKQQRRKRLHLALTFWYAAEWLKVHEWGDIHGNVVAFVQERYVWMFGPRVRSFRYVFAVLCVSLVTTTLALVVAMAVISPSELSSAGFRDLATPYLERLAQLRIEVGRKTHTIGFIYVLNAFFDGAAITTSYVVLRRLRSARGAMRFMVLVFVDGAVSVLCAIGVIAGVQARFYSAHFVAAVTGNLTTSLIIQPTALVLVSMSVVLPILTYCVALVVLLAARWILQFVTGVLRRFVDVNDTIFTHASVLLAATLAAAPAVGKLMLAAYVAFVHGASVVVFPYLLSVSLIALWDTLRSLPPELRR